MGSSNRMAGVAASPPLVLIFLLEVIFFVSVDGASAPNLFTVHFLTDISETPISIQVNRTLAPLGSDRFYQLVQDGFYNQSALFRVVPGFVLQFGISGNSSLNDKWLHSEIKDDPVVGSNTRGTISYATDGPGTRTSQVFINYGNNSRLDALGFAPFGEVINGLEVAEAAFNPTPGVRLGIDQDNYEANGNKWIRCSTSWGGTTLARLPWSAGLGEGFLTVYLL